MSYRTLAVTATHPDVIDPYHGVFNARSIRSLCDRGTAVDVVSPRPFAPPVGPYAEYRRIPRVSQTRRYEVHHPRFFYLLPKRLFYGFSGRSYARRVSSYVEQTFPVPDVVHAYHVYPDGYGMLEYCDRHDRPLFVGVQGTLINEFSSFSRTVRSRIRRTLRESERVLCVSNLLEERVERICPTATSTVVPIGADPDRFPTESTERIRRELELPADETIVLFCGRFTTKKGLDELIDVLPALEGRDVHVFFVGHDGNRRPELEQEIVAHGLTEQTTVYHDLAPLALRRLYAIADVFVLPSHSEGRPTVIYEAMAARTAVVGTDVGGIPEQVVDGETGYVVPPKDADRLREVLLSLCDQPERQERMGTAGYQRLLEHGWTWDTHAEHLESLHEEAIDA